MTSQRPARKSNYEILLSRSKRLMRCGFAIVPLSLPKIGVAKSGKAPMTPHAFKDATKNYAEFKRLLGSANDFNIGIATGSASDIIIVDIDPRNGGNETFRKLKKRLGPLPRTVTCVSGGDGRHLYFRAPNAKLKLKSKLGPGVDLLANGKYAVAPPSRHSSGQRYKWIENCGPEEQDIATLPGPWAKFIQKPDQPERDRANHEVATIPEGARNETLTSLAGILRRAGLDEGTILKNLRWKNKADCNPPLDEEELEKIAHSVSGYPVGPEPRDDGQKIAQALLEAEFGGGTLLRYEVDGQFWSWVGTHWAVVPEKILQRKIIEFVNKKFSSNRSAKALVTEVFGLLQMLQARDDDLLHFASEPPNVVNTLNRELWLSHDGRFKSRRHEPKTGMRHVLNVEYDPDATCPKYDAEISQIFKKAKHPEGLIDFFNELLGYSIQLRRDIPLIVLMIGNGSNGKTSLVNLLMQLVGPNFVHSGRVGELDEARFGIGSLFGKLLFVDDDVRAGAKLPDGALKKISEAKLLTGEHKFKPAFTFVNRAFPILLCNNLPSLADLSLGMMRRIHVVPFGRSFSERESDRGLFDRIIRDELSGVLNRALEGWVRLKRRSRFASSEDMKLAREDLLVHANPLKGFIDECCEQDDKSYVSLLEFYKAYRAWAEESGYTMTQVKSTVKKNLQHGGYIVTKRAPGLVVLGMKLRRD